MEDEYCAKLRCVLVIEPEIVLTNNLFPTAMGSVSGQSWFDLYDLFIDDEESSMSNNLVDMTPGWSDRAPHILTTARVHLNSPPESPKNWGQVNTNLNDYHSDPMDISSTFWKLDITDWWLQEEEMHSKYADLSNVSREIFSIITHGVGFEARFSLWRDVDGGSSVSNRSG